MPAYRPSNIDKKLFDTLKKKYKHLKANRDQAAQDAADQQAQLTDEEAEEPSIQRDNNKHWDISELKHDQLIPFMYGKGDKIQTIADHDLEEWNKLENPVKRLTT
jgi:hypothetical protein